jgi:integrase
VYTAPVATISRIDGKRGVRYRVTYRDPAGRHRSATFRRASDARDYRRQVENDLAGQRWRDPARGREPFAPYLERALASAHELRPSTQALYGTIARKHILPALGDVPIRALDAERISTFLDGLVSRGVGVRTVQIARQVLSRVLMRAVRDRVIPENPVRDVPSPRLARSDVGHELRLLDVGEVKAIGTAIDPRYRPMVLLSAWGGLRWGEVAGLTVGDLDLLRGRVQIARQLTEVAGAVSLGELKTKASARTVTIPKFVAEALAEHLADAAPRARSDFVFTSRRGRPLRRTNWRRRYWLPACREAGISPSPRFHDLRHFAASVAILAGAHPRAIQSRLGHSSITVTLGVYGKLFPTLDVELAEALDHVGRSSDRVAAVLPTQVPSSVS